LHWSKQLILSYNAGKALYHSWNLAKNIKIFIFILFRSSRITPLKDVTKSTGEHFAALLFGF